MDAPTLVRKWKSSAKIPMSHSIAVLLLILHVPTHAKERTHKAEEDSKKCNAKVRFFILIFVLLQRFNYKQMLGVRLDRLCSLVLKLRLSEAFVLFANCLCFSHP